MPRRTVLLSPGPVNVSERVRAALTKGDFCHREPEVLELLQSVRRRLVSLFCPDPAYSATLVMGSGSAALEMAVAATVQGDDRILVVNNGTYGDRIRRMALAHNQKVAELQGAPTERPHLELLDDMLEKDTSIKWVAMVHHETTTGLLNPVLDVARIAHQRGVRVLVDSISGLAGDALPIVELGLDMVVGTANKCIQGLPGVSFVLARRSAIDEAAAHPPTSMYLCLPLLHAEQEGGSHPFTTAVQVMFAFEAALAELHEETVAGRIERLRAAAALLRAGFARLGLKTILAPTFMSNTITSLALPQGMTYAALHDALKARGFIVYAGQGKLAAEIFRVANMGAIEKAELEEFLTVLGGIVGR